MRTHYFLIESERNRHDLLMDGDLVGRFPTFEEAEVEANNLANRVTPGASLHFELDMKSTLNDLEIRGATLRLDTI